MRKSKWKNKEFMKSYNRAYMKIYMRKRREENPRLYRETWKRELRELRQAIFGHYGKTCAWCGANEKLTMDHIDGDGYKHEGTKLRAGNSLYRWLKRNSFPPGFQTLCQRCNGAKGAIETIMRKRPDLKRFLVKIIN
jgi:5-methylcytosine-specific restriction endonuclease McrA